MFAELALLIQKVLRVKCVGVFPLVFVRQDRSQVKKDVRSLAEEKSLLTQRWQRMERILEGIVQPIIPHFRYVVTSQLSGLGGLVGQPHRNNVGHSLDLVDGGINIRKVCSVVHGGTAVETQHADNLLMASF